MFEPDGFDLNKPAADPNHWLLEPGLIFLSHGAFGACPKRVLECQAEWRARMERQPLQFLGRDLEGHLDVARGTLAEFIGADADDLVFVPNATSGVNTVLRSLVFAQRDELLVTDQEYNACRNALNFAAERSGARVVVANLPFPVKSEEQLLTPVLERVTGKTRIALLDHVTSQTGLVLPIERLVCELNARGVDALVDGAHAPGMLPLTLNQLGAAYYTGNCHKWLCAPKGAAFLHVRRDKQSSIRPLTISHGANSRRTDRSRFLIEFAWPGTWDPSAALSVSEALRFVGSLLPGRWPEIMARNRALSLAARKILCAALNIDSPAPDESLGSLAAVPLPDAAPGDEPQLPTNEYALQETLRVKHQIEVPIISWPAPPKRTLRVSAQLYNSLPQYARLTHVLTGELP
jgi:isopenicillin-N epimerase